MYSELQAGSAGADADAGSPVPPLTVDVDKGLADSIKCLLENDTGANDPDEVSYPVISHFHLLVATLVHLLCFILLYLQ